VDEQIEAPLVDRDVEEILAEIEAGEDFPCPSGECGRILDSPEDVQEHLRRWHEPEDEERRRNRELGIKPAPVPPPVLIDDADDALAFKEEELELADLGGEAATTIDVGPVDVEEADPQPPKQMEEVTVAEYVCPDCGATFESGAGLGGHRKIHNRPGAEGETNGALASQKKRTPVGRKSSGRGRRTARREAAKPPPVASGGSIDVELDLVHGILEAFGKLSDEGQAWVMVRLKGGETR
jgi:hypothetical protein